MTFKEHIGIILILLLNLILVALALDLSRKLGLGVMGEEPLFYTGLEMSYPTFIVWVICSLFITMSIIFKVEIENISDVIKLLIIIAMGPIFVNTTLMYTLITYRKLNKQKGN